VQAPPIRDDGLQLEEQRAFQKIFWITERCAWALFSLLLLLVLAGFTGAGGYLATARITTGTIEVEYPRISRWESSEELTVKFPAGSASHRLSLGPAFFEYFEIESAQPQPERTLATRDGTTLIFSAEEAAPTEVILYLRALHPGFPRYSVAADGVVSDLSTTILP
jgi:hypothetical protein